LTWWVKDFTGEEVKIEIENAQGQPVAKLSAPATPGLSRTVWDLKPSKELLTEYGGEGAKFVRPGNYKVKLTCGKAESEQTLSVSIAPGLETR
jgi:hypothetical protein